MVPLLAPLLEGIASYVGFELADSFFSPSKNPVIPTKSKKRVPKPKKKKKQLPAVYEQSKRSGIVTKKSVENLDVVLKDKPKKRTLLDVLEYQTKTNQGFNSAILNTKIQSAMVIASALPSIVSSLETISNSMEHFIEHFEYSKTPVEIKDLEGNTITKMSPREIELTQRATRAKLDNDENNLDINDVIDDYDDTFDLLEKVEELFKFQGITKDITDMKG